ncbi:MAG: glycosyltransferase family 4 protein [Chthoniobacteraceae bacterium]
MGQTAGMRIAMIHYSALPVLGGVEVVLNAHARLFAEGGHEVHVICARGGAAGVGITSHTIQAKGGAVSVETRLTELRPLIARMDAVVMHNVGTMHFDLALTEALWTLAFEMPEVRFIAWVHDVAAVNPDYQLEDIEQPPMSRIRTAHPRWEYVAVSELRAREWAGVSGLALEQIAVVPNGVAPAEVLGLTERIRALSEAQDLWSRDLILLHPTRLLRRKNVELGLAVTEALRNRGVRVACIITAARDAQNRASAEYADGLLRERDARGLQDEAIFLGDAPVSDADLRSLYQLADALFFPSRQEGFGLPMLEAALHRIPAFCAEIEPLRDFPGAIPFRLDSPPAEIAENIIRHFAEWPANPPRRAVLRNFAWSAIYRNKLAPLLTTRNNRQ